MSWISVKKLITIAVEEVVLLQQFLAGQMTGSRQGVRKLLPPVVATKQTNASTLLWNGLILKMHINNPYQGARVLVLVGALV